MLPSTSALNDDPSSSGEHPKEPRAKRRRLHGACDICRRKKIKCNSAEMPNKICSNCIAYNLECTHNIPRHASKKETEKGYIHALEERLDKMEQLLRNVRPELDIEQSVAAANSPAESTHSAHSASTPQSHHSYSHPTPVADIPYPAPQYLSESITSRPSPPGVSNDSSDEEDLEHISLTEQLSKMCVNAVGERFFGKSSGFMFMRHAAHVKQEFTGKEAKIPERHVRRPFFWDLLPCESDYTRSDPPRFQFPEKDLLDSLIDIYFNQLNIYSPVLHRPTFERNVANGLHYRDVGFAHVVLMVAALASRNTSDPRVLLEKEPTEYSRGWKYFRQTDIFRHKLIYKVELHDMQYYCLVVAYLVTTSLPQSAWCLSGIAIRLIQERGMHRRRGDSHRQTIEDELWKRCFWCLIFFDRTTSSFSGRSCAIQDEDFDADLPIECDDEYWECVDPEQRWKQPPGKPSQVTAFVLQLRLCEILAFTLRTLYSTKKSKLLTGLIGEQWEHKIVAELDSSMNKWKDSLPDHLRWNPDQPNQTFLHQSAYLHATFYYLQIQIHRPFIQKPTPLSFPSLAICTNAARAHSHLVDAKGPGWILPWPNIFISTFAAGIVLALHVYGGRKLGLQTDIEKGMRDVQRCMDTLRSMEDRFHIAGRLLDILSEIANFHEEQMLDSKYVSHKRPRDEEPRIESSGTSFKLQSPPTSPTQHDMYPSPPQLKGWPPNPSNPARPSNPNVGERQTQPPYNSPPHIQDPTPSYPAGQEGSDWNLSNFLLAQMNYMQPNTSYQQPPSLPSPQIKYPNALGNSFVGIGTAGPYRTVNASPIIPGYSGASNASRSIPSTSQFSPRAYPPGVTQDMAAMWSDAPENFSIEDWDRFVASMNEQGSNWNVNQNFNAGVF